MACFVGFNLSHVKKLEKKAKAEAKKAAKEAKKNEPI